MNGELDAAYLFSTTAQWDACLFAGVDRHARTRMGLAPQAPYSRVPHSIASAGAYAPTLTAAGDLLWRDGGGTLLRALPHDNAAESTMAPWAIGRATRLVIVADAIWVAGAAPSTLVSFELDTLTRRAVVEIPAGRVLDLAADEQDGLLVLTERDGGRDILRLASGGDLTLLARLDAGLEASRFTSLPQRRRIFLLAERGTLLVALAYGSGTPQWTRQLAAFRPCFSASELGSDARGRVFVAGTDGQEFGGTPCVLVLDDEATLIDALTLPRTATGVAGGRGTLAVSHTTGVDVFSTTAVAGDSTAVECEVITPLLVAPDSNAELKWQRADAWATLPDGSTLELRYGWTTDKEFVERARKLTSDTRLPQSQRLAWLRESLDHWSQPVSFAGSAERAITGPLAPPLAFPLHDARAAALWLHARLRATPRSALPALTRLRVSYAGSAMLRQLPAVYRREAVEPGNFLGALLGTLEATSQELDRRIGTLGSLAHPDTAPEEWLDEVAKWLDLPWDDALTLEQKRAIVRHAGVFAAQRGTRAGLAQLLACLFPETPPPFRISDFDVDLGFATLGGANCCGSMLPAVLAGLPRSATVLSRKTILGHARLPCNSAMPSATRALVGRLRIDLAVDGDVRRVSEPWLERVLDSMLPANLRLQLRWLSAPLGMDPDGGERLFAAPKPHLGRDAITGIARLPYGRAPTLWS